MSETCKCETCEYYEKDTRDVAIHPTSSSCIWNVRTMYICNADVFNKQDHKPARARCYRYKNKK